MSGGSNKTRYTSRRDVAVLFLRQDGKCNLCPRKLRDSFRIDHIIPLWNGGTDTLENKQVLCIDCHDGKTFGSPATSYGSDIHEFAKTERLRKGKPKSKSRWPKRKMKCTREGS